LNGQTRLGAPFWLSRPRIIPMPEAFVS
jgi:hypothetical protein